MNPNLEPMFKSLFIAQLFVFAPIVLQDSGLMKHVVRSWSSGAPYVVVYTEGPENQRVKEELYYESGGLDYVGYYKNGKEHGEWKYFWENGNVKSVAYYERGLEEGTMYDYNEKGEAIIKYRYVQGDLMSQVKLNP